MLGYLRKKRVVISKCCLDNDLLSNILNLCNFSLVTMKILKQNLDCFFILTCIQGLFAVSGVKVI